MIPINIDLTGVIKEFGLRPSVAQDLREFVVKESLAHVAKNWDTEAKNNLTKSREEYRRSLIVVDKGRFEGMIILNGVVPNMIEQGASPFDMKMGFSKSAKKHLKANGGWYLSIPFRIGIPTTLGESAVFSGIMPPEVYNEVKKENIVTKQSILNLPQNVQQPRIRRTVTIKSQTFEEYKSKTSIFVGVRKNSKQYQSANQNTYSSFRRVSENSDKNVFIHTGITARKFSEKAIEKSNFPQLVPMLIDQFLQKAL